MVTLINLMAENKNNYPTCAILKKYEAALNRLT